MKEVTPKYRRVLLKLSGEALAAGGKDLIDHEFVAKVAAVLRKCLDAGTQIGIIVGAGNIWRGRQGREMDSVRADRMGMLATTINAIALQDAFIHAGVPAETMTAVPMGSFSRTFERDEAVRLLESGHVVIFGCGLGLPFLSTTFAA